MPVEDLLRQIHERMKAACGRSGRGEAQVTLVAVAKRQSAEEIQAAFRAGQIDFGENYAQELLAHQTFAPEARWHFIGHLQKNKVKQILPHVSLIHTVDSPELALEIDRRAKALGKVQDVLIEVNIGGEDSKSGVTPAGALTLVQEISSLSSIRLRGLMSLPPFREDPSDVRPFFRGLREMRDSLNKKNLSKGPLVELSMGMTHDFEVAIEEGATIVRIGTGIFGERA